MADHLARGKGGRLRDIVRFCAKVLTGFPSILAGVFAYGAIVLATGGYSAFAGAVALSILMLPTIVLTSEDAIRMVPSRMKDAAIGMGATTTQVTWMVLLPTAIPGILTGVMLAIARAAGETAPLLFTALFSNYWLWSRGHVNLKQPTASLAVLSQLRRHAVSESGRAGVGRRAGLVLVPPPTCRRFPHQPRSSTPGGCACHRNPCSTRPLPRPPCFDAAPGVVPVPSGLTTARSGGARHVDSHQKFDHGLHRPVGSWQEHGAALSQS